MSKTPWILISARVSGFECTRCGGHRLADTPMPLKQFEAALAEFTNQHKDCKDAK